MRFMSKRRARAVPISILTSMIAVTVALACGARVARAEHERARIVVAPVTGKGVDAGLKQRVARAVAEGLLASGADIAPLAAEVGPEGCAAPTCFASMARASGAQMVLQAEVRAEGRSYLFTMKIADGRTGAVIATRENRCEICTEAEALETASSVASTLKAEAAKAHPAAAPEASAASGTGGTPAPASGEGPAVRIAVVEGMELPASLAEYHDKLRSELEAMIDSSGSRLELAPEPPMPSGCVSKDCLKEVVRATGATDVLIASGSRNDYGFVINLEVWNAAHDSSEKAQGWCNFCTGPQMTSTAVNLARPLLANVLARRRTALGLNDAAAAGSSAPAGANLNGGAATGAGGEPRNHTLVRALSWTSIGVGTAAIIGGIVALHGDNRGTCTLAPGQKQCPNLYDNKALGIGLIAGGAVANGAGTWGLLASYGDRTSTVALTGKF
jgi:hypothetical protein